MDAVDLSISESEMELPLNLLRHNQQRSLFIMAQTDWSFWE